MCSSSSSVNYECVSVSLTRTSTLMMTSQRYRWIDSRAPRMRERGPALSSFSLLISFPTRRKVAAAPPVTGFVSGRRARTLSHILCVCEKEQQQQQQQEKQREKKEAGRQDLHTLSQSLLAGWLAH